MPPSPELVVQTLQSEINAAPRFDPLRPFWGGHLQTLGGYFLPQPRALTLSPAQFDNIQLFTEDGDTLIGRRRLPQIEARGVLHVFHGLAGSSNSSYMPRIAEAACALGLITLLWNHRGCGPGRKLARRPYHSGRSDDLGRAIAWGRQHYPHLQHLLLGYSLSANAAALLSAGIVPAISDSALSMSELLNHAQASLPDICIAVNPPMDLYKSAYRLSHGPAKIYGQHFISELIQSLEDRSDAEDATLALLKIKRSFPSGGFTVLEFDAAYTGAAAGFRDHIDYYKRASCGPHIRNTQIPLVILSSEDDPITYGISDLDSSVGSEMTVLDLQRAGGHMGFLDAQSLQTVWSPTLRRWLEERILLYLRAYLSLF